MATKKKAVKKAATKKVAKKTTKEPKEEIVTQARSAITSMLTHTHKDKGLTFAEAETALGAMPVDVGEILNVLETEQLIFRTGPGVWKATLDDAGTFCVDSGHLPAEDNAPVLAMGEGTRSLKELEAAGLVKEVPSSVEGMTKHVPVGEQLVIPGTEPVEDNEQLSDAEALLEATDEPWWKEEKMEQEFLENQRRIIALLEQMVANQAQASSSTAQPEPQPQMWQMGSPPPQQPEPQHAQPPPQQPNGFGSMPQNGMQQMGVAPPGFQGQPPMQGFPGQPPMSQGFPQGPQTFQPQPGQQGNPPPYPAPQPFGGPQQGFGGPSPGPQQLPPGVPPPGFQQS